MEINVTEDYCLELTKVHTPVIFKTETGCRLAIAMRDDGLEISVTSEYSSLVNFFSVNPKTGQLRPTMRPGGK